MTEADQYTKLERLKALSDEDLIAMHLSSEPGFLRHESDREMDRRQLVASRELRSSIESFKRSADRSGKWMIWLTVAIAALTVVLAALTLLLLLRSH